MVKVLISTDTRYPVNRKVIRQAVYDVFVEHNIENIEAEISIAIVGKRKMDELSRQYLKSDGKHGVLAFALEEVTSNEGFINPPDEVLRLGDVVLCWPHLIGEASNKDIFLDDEVYSLISHGVKHLLGEHHQS